MNVDIKTLEHLAEQMTRDGMRGATLNRSSVLSIADIIKQAIGAPLMWPSSTAGAFAAEDFYPGSPNHRAGFNHGVKWAVEHYSPTEKPSERYG